MFVPLSSSAILNIYLGMTCRVKLIFRVLFLVLFTVSVSACPTAAVSQSPGINEALSDKGINPDAVVLNIELNTDGTADWTVEYRVSLSDKETTEAFVSLEQNIEENPDPYLEEFVSGIESTVEAAESSTGREMSVGNFSVSTENRQVPSEYGIVTYSFTWEGFVVKEESYRALDGVDSFFLEESSTMIVSWDRSLATESVSPTPTEERESSIVWSGPIEFAPGEPRVVLSEDGGEEKGGEELEGGTLPGLLSPTVAVVITLLLLPSIVILRRRLDDERIEEETDSGDVEEDELLSNKERVIRLLRERGGRVKQKEVAEEFGWSDAKTSQVVGELKESDEVEVYRLGRENVLKLSEEDSI